LFSFLAFRTNGRAYAIVSTCLLSVSWLNIVFLPKKLYKQIGNSLWGIKWLLDHVTWPESSRSCKCKL